MVKLKNDEKFIHFMELNEIFRDLNSDNNTEQNILNLNFKITQYLNDYKLLYQNARITTKHHFRIHYPDSIRKFGPPKTYNTMEVSRNTVLLSKYKHTRIIT